MEIEEFEIKIIADKELLQPLYRHYLNPFEIEIIGAKELPIYENRNYMPCYIKYSFFDNSVVKSSEVAHAEIVRWNSKHVFLLGFLDQTILKEKFSSNIIKVKH